MNLRYLKCELSEFDKNCVDTTAKVKPITEGCLSEILNCDIRMVVRPLDEIGENSLCETV